MNPLLISAGMKLLETVLDKQEFTLDSKLDLVKSTFKIADEARPFWERKTFWATVVAVAVPILNKATGLNMQIEEVSAAIAPLLAFILGESWRKKGMQ